MLSLLLLVHQKPTHISLKNINYFGVSLIIKKQLIAVFGEQIQIF